MPELQNIPQAQTGAKLRFETVASHVSVGRPSRNVYDLARLSYDAIPLSGENPLFVCTGFAAQGSNEPLRPFSFKRRDPGAKDVQIEIL
jgi:hypothetical protein